LIHILGGDDGPIMRRLIFDRSLADGLRNRVPDAAVSVASYVGGSRAGVTAKAPAIARM
jgi:hypothetical protein